MVSYLLEHNRYLSIVGIGIVFAIAYFFSSHRSAIAVRTILGAFGLQVLLAFLVLRTMTGRAIMEGIAHYVTKIYDFADVGTRFVFGSLADTTGPWGFIFAVKVVPITIFFAALTSLLFHWNIIQMVMAGVNKVVQPLLKTSGAETLVAVANSFLGQTEAPLLARTYLNRMTKSELMVVMISGMGTISGVAIVIYATLGIPIVHLLAASVMGVPATIAIAKILIPETETAVTAKKSEFVAQTDTANIFDAIARGTMDGLQLSLAVVAFLISFLSLIACTDYMLNAISYYFNVLVPYIGLSLHMPDLSMQVLFGYIFAPFAYLLGFTGELALKAGGLLGIKVSINEMVAYTQLLKMDLSARNIAILTYALCGFANFASIGMQIGAIGALAPDRRKWLTELGLLAVLGATLSNLLSAMIAALLL